jgi:hypothetical protein
VLKFDYSFKSKLQGALAISFSLLLTPLVLRVMAFGL